MSRPFVLINSNIIKPPVSPVGLEYVAEALSQAGFKLYIIDLPMEKDWKQALLCGFPTDTLAVGITLRNTDDCSFYSRKYFIPWVRELIQEVRKRTDAPVVLGGVGFSIFSSPCVDKIEADFGIEGDGEDAVVLLAKALSSKKDFSSIHNLVFRQKGRIVKPGRKEVNLKELKPFSRNIFDNCRYEREGAMVGVETKRGCPESCVYCADPVAKGKKYRLRPPQFVAQEIKSLLNQGVSWIHLCDSEFNLPSRHAKEVCQTLINKGLSSGINWYCYCSPTSFDRELAGLMKRAGCAGINFGVDSMVDSQLASLGRKHRLKDLQELVKILKEEGLNFIFDLLIGGKGETEETLRSNIEASQKMQVPLVGMSLGVRLYPGTPLSKSDENGILRDGLYGELKPDLLEPLFYISPVLGDNPAALLGHYAGGDPRFLLLAEPGEEGSYNYAGDNILSDEILKGARGAYWDILAKVRKSRVQSQGQ